MKSGEQVKDLKLSPATRFNTANDFEKDNITGLPYSDHNLQPPGLNGEDLNHAMVLLSGADNGARSLFNFLAGAEAASIFKNAGFVHPDIQ